MLPQILMFAALVSVSAYPYPVSLEEAKISLPQIEDQKLTKILQHPKVIFYKLHPTYQQYVPKHNRYNIFYQEVLVDYNSNLDFPWETTFGFNHVKKEKTNFNYLSLDFIYPTKPILVIPGKPAGWIFPINIVVGEILFLKDGETWLPFEIRIRIKKEDTWEPLRYAPIKNNKELMALIGDYKPAKKYLFLRNNVESEVFKIEGMVERVPPIDPAMVRKLLKRPFKNVTHEAWSEVSAVPTSDEIFNIVPKNYSLGLLPSVDSESCSNCHRQTGISVNNLVPEEPIIRDNQEKVGNIRGSDGIFSWYPFHESCIQSKEGTQPVVKYRTYDVENKIIEFYDPKKKYGPEYKLTEYVDHSLKPYEKISVQQFLNVKDMSKLSY